MTLVDDDTAAARRAVEALVQRAQALARHHGDTLDVRRLLADVGRLSEDLDLLCGPPAPVEAQAPAAPELEHIPDSSYTHDFWMDAEDEGLGRR